MSDQQQHQIQSQEVRYMTDEECDNYNPQDFNSQAQFQLSDFITLTSLYRRKIPHKAFADFNDLVYDRREELRDQEYMDIMERLARLLPNVSKECPCTAGSNKFCNSGIDEFIYCQNYSMWTDGMQQLEYIRFTQERPNYSHSEYKKFLADHCTTPLQIHMGINPKNIGDDITRNYLTVIKDIQTLCSIQGVNRVARTILLIMHYKFCLENISPDLGDLTYSMRRFWPTLYKKCDDLIYECTNPSCGQAQQILGWTECPFRVVKKLIENNRHFPVFEDIPS
jgi:hypothetical protein